ncbi:site-specific integrase [Acidobacteria bacterium AH-259-D05]|nr:site-specific integrase [Acidobacteria bacterium AH-259-D05]
MIELLFERAHVWARLQSGPLGPYVEAVAKSLQEKRYRPATICRYVRSAELFCCWLARRKIPVAETTEILVHRYIRALGRHPCPGRLHGRLPGAAFGLNEFLEVLRKQGVIPLSSVRPALKDEWLVRFAEHLDRTVGVTAGTRQVYLRYARSFLRSQFGSGPPDVASLAPENVTMFVRKQASRLKPSSSRLLVTATRAFLRFLVSQNAIAAGLEHAVPTIRQWKLASLPKFLSAEAVARVLAQSEQSTPVGQRNRAILLLLARLGLRAVEVSRLTLDDIDWREGSLSIPACKCGRGRILPLPGDAGWALACYLQNARPKSPSRALFLRCRAPYTPLHSQGVVARSTPD